MKLLEFSNQGIYCGQAGVYIDPWKPVDMAIITHAHSDHARWGSKKYICHKDTKPVLLWRLGPETKVSDADYNEAFTINGVHFSFHPAGHIIGSSQVRVEYKGEVWVVSGDYKLEDDGLSTPFEPVRCNVFITESTFGLPIYKWPPQQKIFDDIHNWWYRNQQDGLASVLTGYSLGKAQRLLANIDRSIGPVFVHGAIHNINRELIRSGVPIPDVPWVSPEMKKEDFRRALIIAPPSAINSPWMKKFYPYSSAVASGWMSLRGTRRRRSVDRGFAISDHADWNGLNLAIKETGAEKVVITHGYRNIFARWLKESHYDAWVEETQFEGELSEIGESAIAENETESSDWKN
jgi:putative mRNA 3-end processing factor